MSESETVCNLVITNNLFTAHLALVFVLVVLRTICSLLVFVLTLHFGCNIFHVYLHLLSIFTRYLYLFLSIALLNLLR